MLKVANIIEDGRIAGPQLRILAVAEALKREGIHTTVIHPSHQAAQFAARLDGAGITRVALPIQRLSRGWIPIFRYFVFFPFEIFMLWNLFRRERFDFVHCSGGFWQIKGLIAAKLANTRSLWHMNDTILPLRLRPLFLFVCRHFVYRLIFAGQRVREHYLGDADITTPVMEIQAPVNCAKFDPARAIADSKIVSASLLRLVTVANLNPLKGLEYFVQMAARLSREFENVSFHIVGPIFDSQSGYLSRLKAMIEESAPANINLHGSCDDIPSVLAAADIYVCSSIAEASPTSVWEAMAMGKAIVSTDVGDVARFVTDGENGFIVPVGDANALAKASARFLRDADLRQMCGAAVRLIAVEELDLRICVTAHQRAYS